MLSTLSLMHSSSQIIWILTLTFMWTSESYGVIYTNWYKLFSLLILLFTIFYESCRQQRSSSPSLKRNLIPQEGSHLRNLLLWANRRSKILRCLVLRIVYDICKRCDMISRYQIFAMTICLQKKHSSLTNIC